MKTPLVSAITPAAGGWIIIKKFEKEVESILYDPTSPNPELNDPDSLRVVGWPYSQATPVLWFTEQIPNASLEAAKTATIGSKGVDVGEKKYKEIREYFDLGFAIGVRQECVWTIKELEQHPAVAEDRTKDNVGINIALFITVRTHDPIAAIRINFLKFAETLVCETFRNWIVKRTYEEVMLMNTDDDPAIPDEICERIEELSETQFIPNGFQVPHVAVMKITVSEDSKEFLKTLQEIKNEQNREKKSIETQKIEIRENETQGKRNDTKLAFLEKEAAIQINLIEKTSAGIAQQNGAWGGALGLRTLAIGDEALKKTQIQLADATVA